MLTIISRQMEKKKKDENMEKGKSLLFKDVWQK